MRSRAPSSRWPRAFSLLELVIVLAILGVLCAIAIPRYTSAIVRYRADLAARRIVADLALAQCNARTTGTPQTVTFDPSSSTYQLVGVADPDHPASPYIVNLSSDPYRAALVSAGFSGAAQLTFDSYGFPDRGGTLIVQSGSFQRTITLNAASGKAALQ